MSNNPYVQVARMYLRSLRGALLLFLVVCYGLPLLMAVLTRTPGMATSTVMMAPYMLIMAANVIVWPFATWQSQLIPGFRRAHAVVVIAAIFLLAVAFPAAVAFSVERSVLAAVAIAVFFFAMVLFSLANDATSQRPPFFWAVFFVAMLLPAATMLTPPLKQAMVLYFAGDFPMVATIALLLGFILLALSARQLARVDGDARGETGIRLLLRGLYPRQSLSPWKDVDHRAIERHNRLTGVERRIGHVIQHAQNAGASPWSAVCRWRVGMPNGWRSWLLGTGIAFVIQVIACPILESRIQGPAFFGLSLLLWLVGMPILLSIGQITYRNWMISLEMMLPIPRPTYFRQIALASAVGQFRVWSGMCLAFMLGWLVAKPIPFQPIIALNVVLGSALLQVGLFGLVYLTQWLAYRKSPMFWVTVMGVWGIGFGVAMANFSQFPVIVAVFSQTIWPCLAAGVVAMLGLLLMWFTYRYWLITDLN